MEESQDENVPMVVSKEEKVESDFEQPFDRVFWTKVHNRYEEKVEEAKQIPDGVSVSKRLWSRSLDEIRAERIRDQYSALARDPVVAIMKDWLKFFLDKTKPQELELLRPNFENQLSKLALVIIDQECKKCACPKDGKHNCNYGRQKRIFTDADGTKKGLLHIAAEQNLYILAKGLISRFPGQLYVTSRGGVDLSRIPVEYALLNFNDETASEIIKSMQHDRVRMLMQFDEAEGRCRFKFCDFIKKPNMTKTVIAVLDCLVNPDWPYIPVEKEEEAEKEWSCVPDIPIRYHFFYRILDGDQEGRAPYFGTSTGVEFVNEAFDAQSSSCFKMLLQSSHKETVISHPAMRMLARRKWDQFGALYARVVATIYILFLVTMSIALLGAVNSSNPLHYRTRFDYLRAVCEILAILIAVFYFAMEIDQLEKERRAYFLDFQNYMDVLGIVLLLLVVPLRLAAVSSQWSLAAVAFLVNFLGLLKYLTVWQFIGMYAKVLTQLLLKDISKFLVIFIVLMFSFGGSIYLALKATGGLANVSYSFGYLLFREVRALTEGKEFADSYSNFKNTVVILIMVNMFMILLILVNMLIAQLSSRYEQAKAQAEVSFDIDKALIVAKLEQSRFKRFNLRIRKYTDGDFAVNKKEVKDLLVYWDMLKHQMRGETLPGLQERQDAMKSAGRDEYKGVLAIRTS